MLVEALFFNKWKIYLSSMFMLSKSCILNPSSLWLSNNLGTVIMVGNSKMKLVLFSHLDSEVLCLEYVKLVIRVFRNFI